VIPSFLDRRDGTLEAQFDNGFVVVLGFTVARTRVQAYHPIKKGENGPMSLFRKHAYQRAALQAFLSGAPERIETDRDGDLYVVLTNPPRSRIGHALRRLSCPNHRANGCPHCGRLDAT
jgi:hypothetical protein